MPQAKQVRVSDLHLDLANYRTVTQSDEIGAANAMLSVSPDWFLALMDSILEDGYVPIENIIALEEEPDTLVVKEGNRRIAILKLLLGIIPADAVQIPEDYRQKIATVDAEWRNQNSEVSCALYSGDESDKVDAIVSRTHGYGQKAGRLQWNAIARARHDREKNRANRPALDLLEKFLASDGGPEAARWAGIYPYTVLEEAVKRLHKRFGATSAMELAAAYPAVLHKDALDSILRDIGLKIITFDTLRTRESEMLEKYGVTSPSPTTSGVANNAGPTTGGNSTHSGSSQPPPANSQGPSAGSGPSQPTSGSQAGPGGTSTTPGGVNPNAAVSSYDPENIKRLLRSVKPLGVKRHKVKAVLDECLRLNIKRTPLAFGFLVRSAFELSAKAYCDDHAPNGPKAVKADGNDRNLVDVLRDVGQHLIKNGYNKRDLHGAMAELNLPVSLLSVTSMNQLIHNPHYVVSASEMCVSFARVFPLLDAMNK